MLDMKLTGGQVLDGTGAPPVVADIGISGDRITAVEDLDAAEARLSLDVTGRTICPGFIDVHSHSDAYLLIEPSAPSKIYQGITTEIVGNCGASAAPLAAREHLPSDWQDKSYPGSWRTVAEYARLLDQVKPAPNVVLLIGHGKLRGWVMGYEARPASPDETARMERLLDQSLDEGGSGFSTGLIYAPGMFATQDELVVLAKVAARYGGIYASHMRNEGRRLPEALREILWIAETAQIRVEISHLKTSGQSNWHLLDEALELIRSARERGLEVAADRYPYTASCTDMDVLLPAWAAEGGKPAILNRLRGTADRARLHEELTASHSPDYWSSVVVGSVCHPENKPFRGQSLIAVAKTLGVDPAEAVLHLIDRDELKTSAFFFGMSEDNMWRILAEPWVMLGTDASLRAPQGQLASDTPHPRAYGSMVRFLRAALDGRTVPLPEAIRKMTSLPADHFRLAGRGRVAVGAFADIVVFDPRRVRDAATYESPHQLAEGIDSVVVNGVLTLTDGRLTGRRSGRILRCH